MDLSAYELLHAGYATELERTRPIQHEIRELSQLLDKVLAEVARLEDLRRWRPLSEIPAGRNGLDLIFRRKDESGTVFRGSYIRGQGWLIESGWVAAANEVSWEWTYIPGQEPK